MPTKVLLTDKEAERLFVELGVRCSEIADSWQEEFGDSTEGKIQFCMTVACAVKLVRDMLGMENSPIGEDFFREMTRRAHEWHLAGSPNGTGFPESTR